MKHITGRMFGSTSIKIGSGGGRLRARPATDRSTHSLRLMMMKLRLKVLPVHEFNAHHHRARLALVK